MYVQEIPMIITGIIAHIASVASNPLSLIKEAYLNPDGIKVLIKTSIRSPIRKLQSLFTRSLSPLATQAVEIIMVGYDNLIYEDVILQIMRVLECFIRIIEILDRSQMIVPELKNFYNSIGQVLGIGTTFDLLMRCAYIKNISDIQKIGDIFVNLLTTVYESIEDIFNQFVNIAEWINASIAGNLSEVKPIQLTKPKELVLPGSDDQIDEQTDDQK